MKYNIYLGTFTDTISRDKDGDIFKNSDGLWQAIYWNLRGNGFIEHTANSLQGLKQVINMHSLEHNYSFKIKKVK